MTKRGAEDDKTLRARVTKGVLLRDYARVTKMRGSERFVYRVNAIKV
jgi:hypothetical protein